MTLLSLIIPIGALGFHFYKIINTIVNALLRSTKLKIIKDSKTLSSEEYKALAYSVMGDIKEEGLSLYKEGKFTLEELVDWEDDFNAYKKNIDDEDEVFQKDLRDYRAHSSRWLITEGSKIVLAHLLIWFVISIPLILLFTTSLFWACIGFGIIGVGYSLYMEANVEKDRAELQAVADRYAEEGKLTDKMKENLETANNSYDEGFGKLTFIWSYVKVQIPFLILIIFR